MRYLLICLLMLMWLGCNGTTDVSSESMPMFRDGIDGLNSFIASKVKRDSSFSGTVLLEFTITKVGQAKDIVVLSADDSYISQQVVSILENLRLFVPGRINGSVADVRMKCPIRFKRLYRICGPEPIEYESKVRELDPIYDIVDVKPVFPDGRKALEEAVKSSIIYPDLAKFYKIEGNVVVKFVVKKDGMIGECKVIRSKDPDLDKEAYRVVKNLPVFIPGKLDGRVVSCWDTVTVPFELQDSCI